MMVRLLFALILVFALTIFPLPASLTQFRPPWVLLFVLYMQFCLPNYFNLMLLFFIGLCMDVLSSTLLGEHVFALFFATWVASTRIRRFNFFPLGQQMSLMLLYCCVYQFVFVLIDAFLSNSYSFVAALGSSLIGMLMWPWVRIMANSTLWVKRRVYS